jgi:hypothetical protein
MLEMHTLQVDTGTVSPVSIAVAVNLIFQLFRRHGERDTVWDRNSFLSAAQFTLVSLLPEEFSSDALQLRYTTLMA